MPKPITDILDLANSCGIQQTLLIGKDSVTLQGTAASFALLCDRLLAEAKAADEPGPPTPLMNLAVACGAGQDYNSRGYPYVTFGPRNADDKLLAFARVALNTDPKAQPTWHLYEARNGRVGQSYVRCYVWAIDPKRAQDLLKSRPGAGWEPNPPTWKLRLLMSVGATPQEFVTTPSDEGWEA